jgi:hypothetical protein
LEDNGGSLRLQGSLNLRCAAEQLLRRSSAELGSASEGPSRRSLVSQDHICDSVLTKPESLMLMQILCNAYNLKGNLFRPSRACKAESGQSPVPAYWSWSKTSSSTKKRRMSVRSCRHPSAPSARRVKPRLPQIEPDRLNVLQAVRRANRQTDRTSCKPTYYPATSRSMLSAFSISWKMSPLWTFASNRC